MLDWVLRRCVKEDIAVDTAIGKIPKFESLNLDDLEEHVDLNVLFHLPREFCENEANAVYKYFDEQVNSDLPKEIMAELEALKARIPSL